ncbi:MAG: GNAT family N-acetyltransferase [Candidatus Bathyarchaeia archaeon]
MAEFVPFDLDAHKEEYRQLNIEHLAWAIDQLMENYQLDVYSGSEQTIPEYVDEHLEDLTSLKPPDGIIYLLVLDGNVVGMGALRKLSDDTGEIKRMYIRPPYRGRGYGKQMLSKLLEAGREFGCSTFLLDTAKFMTAAQHIYRSAGFKERKEYPESEIPATFLPYWLFMEKVE